MNAIQQKCRPKHQVLVLKCYPRTTKGAVDVKPNSSELSYLLFYATSRRSKIQKVGQFLEKKTASDVWRQRIGNVQVTLQILAALIEKSPKDLPLFAPNVLRILGLVLRSNEITMVQASLPTFGTFCEHHDASSLFADQTYIHQYEETVRSYATFASTRQTPGKGIPSKPMAMRWRDAGLEAIKSVAEADALSSVTGRQLGVIVPMILENLWTDNEDFLDILIHRARQSDTAMNESGTSVLHRQNSNATVRTADGADTNPLALSGSTADADKLAEEDIGVSALQCLKQIFVVPNRAQLQEATAAFLKFVKERVQQKEAVVKVDACSGRYAGWAIKMYGLVADWAPVQDRYVILFVTVEALLQTKPSEDKVPEQLVLAAMISSLLQSDVNLIGLSVMDVLNGLIQHVKRVLRYAGYPSIGAGLASSPHSNASLSAPATPHEISAEHGELLVRIQQNIGDLATHVYYADQISDMISAILLRLKLHPGTANNTPPAERADISAGAGASQGNLSDDQQYLDSYFATALAKSTALKAIKAILLVANPKTRISGNVSLARNRVPMQVWEGTHWLLRDPDGQVRKAYADALITWLDRETSRADLKAREDSIKRPTRFSNAGTAGRRVSSAGNQGGHHEKQMPGPHSHFLQLLHLAIYDNALQFIEYETDLCLCHVLLVKLVSRLGVNAVRYGLPMIFRLQEDIQAAETPLAKVRLGSLCHGYFWALSEQFDLASTLFGQAVSNEISRRRSKKFWVEDIIIPPSTLEVIGTPGLHRPPPKLAVKEVASEALLPFDERSGMVESICRNYQDGLVSPPGSPCASPGRSQPIFTSTANAGPVVRDNLLPAKIRDDMLIEWTREAAVAALQAASKSASINGSKTGTTGTMGNRLTVSGLPNGGPASPVDAQPGLRPLSQAAGLGGTARLRKGSSQSRMSGRSNSSRGLVTSVDQLKSVLSGEVSCPLTFHTLADDDSSESMASYEDSPSELSYNATSAEGAELAEVSSERSRSKSRERNESVDSARGPLSSHPTEAGELEEEELPPVPPLPRGVAASPISVRSPASTVSTQDYALKVTKRHTKTRGGESMTSSPLADHGAGSIDLHSLLKGIDTRSREHTLGNLASPPY